MGLPGTLGRFTYRRSEGATQLSVRASLCHQLLERLRIDGKREPTQLSVQASLSHQLLDARDPHEPRPLEVSDVEAVVAVGRKHLLDARAHRPFGVQLGKGALQLGEADAVA